MTDEDSTFSDGVGEHRRDFLKKAGLAAGVAWTAPLVISSFTTAAAAASGTSGCQSGGSCGTFVLCGSGQSICACATTTEGFDCLSDFACGGQTCNASSDCGPGGFCVVNTCCGNPTDGNAGWCTTACSTPAPAPGLSPIGPAQLGKTAFGL